MIREKATEDLRHMTDEEGLILQGCGGDLQEWVDGINELLTQEGIMLNVSKFENAATFQHDGLTNLLLSFDGVQLNVGKLAMWRIQTHSQFGGTWLSDYVPNRLGGFLDQPNQQERAKPYCSLIEQDGNIFNLMGAASRTLREHGMDAQAKEMCDRITGGNCHTYHEALCIISEYTEPNRSPAERVRLGEEARGSVRSFRRQAETEQSGLCADEETDLPALQNQSKGKKEKHAYER